MPLESPSLTDSQGYISEQKLNNYGQAEIARTANNKLETWPCEIQGIHVHLEHPEFTSLCPRSGYPDMATIVIDYVPQHKVLELKAFKLWLNSYRGKQISHENVIGEITARFMREVEPRSLRVVGDFMRRGGVKTVVTLTRGVVARFEPYVANVL